MIPNAKIQSASSLKGKNIVITGATSGIGLQAAFDFASLGARVIGVGRDSQRCSSAKQQILERTPKAQVEYLLANLSSQSQVRSLAVNINTVLKRWGQSHLDILINDAGTYSGRRILTEDGAELTMAVNHYAPFLLTHELMPLLSVGLQSMILTVSSGSHYNTSIHVDRIDHPLVYFGLWAYKVSKLANVLFTLEFNRRFGKTNIRAFAVDPGLVNTDIALKGTDPISKFVWQIRKNSGTSPEVPVQTMLFLTQQSPASTEDEYYWKDSVPKTPSRAARDPDLARQLWERSCKMCKTPDWMKEK